MWKSPGYDYSITPSRVVECAFVDDESSTDSA